MSRYSLHPFPMRLMLSGAILVISLVACGPVLSDEIVDSSPVMEATSAITEVSTQAPTLAESSGEPGITITPRGPDLVATDPTTVNLASGGLQLVEFFRFT